MDLAEFLTARLGEDEYLANRTLARWQNDPSARDATLSRWERALREVAAKRAILDEHMACYPVHYPKPSGQPTCNVCHSGGWDWDPEKWPCATVRALAAVWADHPDYEPAWKP